MKERLRQLIAALKMNENSFSTAIGASTSTTRTYTERGSKVSQEYLEKVAQRFAHVNTRWLLTGEGEMFTVDQKPAGFSNQQSGSSSNTQVGGDMLANSGELIQCRTLLEAVRKLYEARTGEACPI